MNGLLCGILYPQPLFSKINNVLFISMRWAVCAHPVEVSIMASVSEMRSALEKWSVEELISSDWRAVSIRGLCLTSGSGSDLSRDAQPEMMKLKSNQTRTYDGDGYKKRAACLCFRNETEQEVSQSAAGGTGRRENARCVRLSPRQLRDLKDFGSAVAACYQPLAWD